jgi:hypothetical protein
MIESTQPLESGPVKEPTPEAALKPDPQQITSSLLANYLNGIEQVNPAHFEVKLMLTS